MVITPSDFNSSFMPPTKSLMSGTCASTLLPNNRSALLPSSNNSLAVCTPKNLTTDAIPFSFSAAAATLAQGSTPKTGTPFALKCCNR